MLRKRGVTIGIHTTLDQSIITWCLIFQFFIQHHINIPTIICLEKTSSVWESASRSMEEWKDVTNQDGRVSVKDSKFQQPQGFKLTPSVPICKHLFIRENGCLHIGTKGVVK